MTNDVNFFSKYFLSEEKYKYSNVDFIHGEFLFLKILAFRKTIVI